MITQVRQLIEGGKWLSVRDLARLTGASQPAIRWRCQTGYYKMTEKVRGRGGDRNGLAWRISIDDPRVDEVTRTLYYIEGRIINLIEKTVKFRFENIKRQLDIATSKIDWIEKVLRRREKE